MRDRRHGAHAVFASDPPGVFERIVARAGREDVSPSKSLEYFLSTQHWLDAFPAPREPHYARLCTHLGSILSADASAVAAAAQARATQTTGTAHALEALQFDAAELRRLELELARFVGPFAKQLVKRAASRVSCIEELVQDSGWENRIRRGPASIHQDVPADQALGSLNSPSLF